EQEKIFYIISLFQVFVTSVVTYLLVVVEKLANFGYVVGIFSGWLIVFLLSMFTILWSKRKFIGEIKPDFSILKLSINFALPQIPARIGSFFIQFGNRFIVLSYFGSATVALFGVSVKFAAPFQLLYIAFTMAWNPYLYKNETSDDLEFKINKILKLLLIFVLLSSVALHYGSHWIIDKYFQNNYKEVKSLIFIAVLPSGLLIAKDILETGVRLSGKTKYISHAYFLSVTVTISLMLLSKNINNVFESTLIGTITLLLATYYYSEKVYHFKYSRCVLYTLCGLLIIILGNMII
ncbi:O98 family O-antigen flippase, partial [Escherichia coli]|nr:O98 family O-antigen flippase [Escherichia coli]EIS9761555.1 O98 family O-antigen flippase [Escherichia coli]